MSWEPFGRSTPDAPQRGTLAHVLAANREVAASHKSLPRDPARRLAVVTCMDARIDPLRNLGLRPGDAHVVRIAGARLGDEVRASLEVSMQMGTREVLLIGHTNCAGYDDDQHACEAARADAQRLRLALPALTVHALFFDVVTGRLEVLDN